MGIRIGTGVINQVNRPIEYIPTGYDSFVTSDNRQFVTSDDRDFNVREP